MPGRTKFALALLVLLLEGAIVTQASLPCPFDSPIRYDPVYSLTWSGVADAAWTGSSWKFDVGSGYGGPFIAGDTIAWDYTSFSEAKATGIIMLEIHTVGTGWVGDGASTVTIQLDDSPPFTTSFAVGSGQAQCTLTSHWKPCGTTHHPHHLLPDI